VGRPPQELIEGMGEECPLVRILDLTTDRGIRFPCNLGEEGKKGSVVWEERAWDECRDESRDLGSEEVLKVNKLVLIIENRET
jgi:hypothetical protein